VKALLRKRRAGDVAAESLELGAVTPVDALLGVHVESRDLCNRLVVIVGRRGSCARVLRGDQPQRRLSGPLARHRDALSRRRVVGRQCRLVDREQGRRVDMPMRVESFAVCSKNAGDAIGGAAGDIGHVGARGGRKQRVARSPLRVSVLRAPASPT
jgi:hypothetical protein